MPCSPFDNTISPPPGVPIPGIGMPIAPIRIPMPEFELPEGFPEDLLELLEMFKLPFIGVDLTPDLDNFTKSAAEAVSQLLGRVAPILALYQFLMPAFNLILCIISIFCAVPNPFKMAAAIKRLFKKCLPDFLSIFPWMALYAMILALLLLLMALIRYIIATLISYIEDIIRNINNLSRVVAEGDADATLAITAKIASLICLIQNLVAILVAFDAVLSIIKSLANVRGRGVCSDNSSDSNDVDCCSPDVCPNFIKMNPDGIFGKNAEIKYHREIRPDLSAFGSIPGFDASMFENAFRPLRNESWQFYNPNSNAFNLKDIITPVEGNIFWPEGVNFDLSSNSNTKKLPYTFDMNIILDPKIFHPNDTKGRREFKISDCYISSKPYLGVYEYDNVIDANINTGTAQIIGGLVYEKDGSPYLVDGKQATLNTFIHLNPLNSKLPTNDDGLRINVIDYTWKINHESLMSYNLITAGCLPDIAIEREVVNAQFADIMEAASKITFPDISACTNCLNDSIEELRKNITLDSVALFQAKAESCLNDLQNQTVNAYKQAVRSGFSQYSSSIEIEPEVQFTSSKIQVKITPKDQSGNPVAFNIPDELVHEMEQLFEVDVTLGSVDDIVYDGDRSFVTYIRSNTPGKGELTASFDSKQFSKINGRDSDTTPSSIDVNVLEYEFVGGVVSVDADERVRRDIADIHIDVKV